MDCATAYITVRAAYHRVGGLPLARRQLRRARAPVERVNGDFIGCVVPAGDHDVALEFRPMHLDVGKAISLSGLVLVVMLAAGSRAGRRRRG